MIIDFHTHAFPDKLAPKAIAALSDTSSSTGVSAHTDGTVGGLLDLMKSAGIDVSVVCNIATNAKQQHNVNEFALAVKKEHKNLIPLASVHPDSESIEEDVWKLHEDGFPGIKLHPDYVHTEINDKKFEPVFDACEKTGMFVITHAGFDPISPDHVYATPKMISEVAAKHPSLKLVAAHFGGCRLWNDVETYLVGKNIYLDLSLGCILGLPVPQAKRIIAAHDNEKLLFASDAPWCDPSVNIDYINSLGLDAGLLEMIYFKNAAGLLGKSLS